MKNYLPHQVAAELLILSHFGAEETENCAPEQSTFTADFLLEVLSGMKHAGLPSLVSGLIPQQG